MISTPSEPLHHSSNEIFSIPLMQLQNHEDFESRHNLEALLLTLCKNQPQTARALALSDTLELAYFYTKTENTAFKSSDIFELFMLQ